MDGEDRSVVGQEMTEEEFGVAAAAVSPTVSKVVRECIETFGIEYIHILVSELGNYIRECLAVQSSDDPDVQALMELFDRAMRDGDKFLKEGIAGSLVENSKWNYPDLHQLFGPNLRIEWQRQEDWDLNRDQRHLLVADKVQRWWIRLWKRLKS